MNRALRRLLLSLVLCVVLLSGVTGYFAWRLRRGPIDLAWLRPYVEASVRSAQAGLALTVGNIELGWDPEPRRIELRAVDVRLRHAESSQELALPTVAIHPRLLPLLRGRIELHHLTLIAPRLSLARTDDGVMLHGSAGKAEAEEGAPPVTTTALLKPLHELLKLVGFIEVRGGEISIDDQPLAHTWGVQQLRATLAIVAGGLHARADAVLHSGTLNATVSIEATEGEGDTVALVAGVDQVVPAALVQAIPVGSRFRLPPALEEVLSAVTSPITAEGHFALSREVHFDGPLHIRAHGDNFTIADAERGLRLRDGSLQLDVEVDVATTTARINELTISFAEVALEVDGALTKLASESRLELRGSVKRFPVSSLRHYWPASIAPDARRWVTENITGGAVKDVAATVQLTLGTAGRADRVDLKAAFDELAVRFAPDMPRATSVRGSVSVSKGESTFTVERGRLDQLEITGGTVRIVPSVQPKPARVDVDVDVRGPLARAVAVLDHDPVFLARNLSVSPDDVEGAIDAKVRCTIPLTDSADPAPIFSGSAQLESVALRQPINGWSVGAGRFAVRLADGAVGADGRAEVATVPMSITVRHQIGAARSSSVQLQARLDAPARIALGIDLGETISGAIPVTATFTPEKDAMWAIDLNADLTAAQFSPPVVAFGKAAGRAGKVTAHVLLTGAKMMRVERFNIDAGGTFAHGSAEHGPDGWRMLRAQLRMPGTARAGAGVMVEVAAQRQGDEYAVSVSSNDAGAVVDHFLAGDVRGGTLAFDGTVRLNDGNPPVQGRLDIRGIHLSHSPLIARVLTLGSFSGLKRTVMQEGVHFDQIGADLTYQQGTVRMANGRADGDAMAILAAGSFDTNVRQMDVRSSVIPSYYGLNSAPQKIPILGPLVARATGEALQIIDARVHGSFDDPAVTIAPASMLAPESVREQLRAWRGGQPKR